MNTNLRPSRSLAALLLGLAACGGGGSERPNVVLITLDTTRPDYLSCYGYTAGHTPHLDALAAGGTRFDMAISASAVTPVSHASILTGNFPYTHGLRVLSAPSGARLPKDQPMLSTMLKEEGYETGAVHSAFPVSSYFGFARDFDWFESMEGEMQIKETDTGKKGGWDTKNLQRRSDDTMDLALEWIGGRDDSFFLWMHLWDPHDPTLRPPPEFMAEYGLPPELTEEHRDQLYAVEVRYIDQQLGRLFQGLKDRGIYDNTIVVVTADHGEGLSDGQRIHGWPMHRMVYQEQIRVPLIVHTPEKAGRSEVDDVVRTVDIVPTILDYAGLEVPPAFDGLSLRPLIEGTSDAPRIAYADQINGYDANAGMVERRPDAKFLFCLMDGDWKFTWRPHMPGRGELFNLAEDPRERVNLIRDPEQSDRVRAMLIELAEREPWVVKPFEDDGSADPSAVAQLEALGYTGGSGAGAPVEWVWICPQHPQDGSPTSGAHSCGTNRIPIVKPE